ncbi:GGDEF domain-containing protein [Shewanella sp. 202IG2-18]|nr:GGDEF domain-containing protein [Parashewanella hymeniacidonis]
MRSLALRDSLTQCDNRLALHQHYEEYRLRDSVTNFHLLLLDIDYFKLVNDNYGHEAGDLVLKKVAMEITQLLNGNRLYRIGGEEFCIIFNQKT